MSLALSRKRDRMRAFEELCRAHGFSLTVQRRAVFETLLKGRQHLSADDVHQLVQDRSPGLSKTTVYRALDTLVELGVIRKVYQPAGPALFDSCTQPHHHAACTSCGKVVDLDDDDLSAAFSPPERIQGFDITEAHVFLCGTCPECLRARRGSRKRESNDKSTKPATTGSKQT